MFCEQSDQVGDLHKRGKTRHVEETYTETEYRSDYESYPDYYEYYEDDIDLNNSVLRIRETSRRLAVT